MKVIKSLATCFFSFLSLLLLQVGLVSGKSDLIHGTENGTWYLIYLAEEEYDPGQGQSRKFTIAPGCQGSRAGGRCTYSEFLEYIQPNRAANQPKGYSRLPQVPADFTTLSIRDMAEKTRAARFAAKGKHKQYLTATGLTDVSRVFPSSPQLGYADMVAAIAKRGAEVALPADKSKPVSEKLARIADTLPKAYDNIEDLRFEDNAKFERQGVAKLVPFTIKTKSHTNSEFKRTYQTVDFVETFKGFTDQTKRRQAMVQYKQALDKLRSTDKSAKSHRLMIEAARNIKRFFKCRGH